MRASLDDSSAPVEAPRLRMTPSRGGAQPASGAATPAATTPTPATPTPTAATPTPAAPRARARESVQSLERGLAVIRAFDAGEHSVSEVAAEVGMTRATVRRILITLKDLGYMETDGRTFRLTPRVLQLGYAYLSALRFPEVALPHLERMVDEVDEPSEATVLDGDAVVYVLRVPSSTLLTAALNVGARMPAYATSMGRVLVASLSDDQLEEFVLRQELHAYRPRTVTDRAKLRAELMQARRDGYAIVDQELEEGLIAVAVPVRNRQGAAIGAINLSTHVARRGVDSVRSELVGPLKRAAAAIEADLVKLATPA